MTDKKLDARSKKLRSIVVDALKSNGGGHIGSSMSTIEILRVLYDSILKFEASQPSLADRDRFILSKGHGCLALYSILADKQFFPVEELQTFCKPTSKFGGHPERGKVPGVEASTGGSWTRFANRRRGGISFTDEKKCKPGFCPHWRWRDKRGLELGSPNGGSKAQAFEFNCLG